MAGKKFLQYLHLYNTESDFNTDYNGEKYHEPWTSYIKDATKRVNYNKKQSPYDLNGYLTMDVICGGTISWIDRNFLDSSATVTPLHSTIEYSVDSGMTWVSITSDESGSEPRITVSRGNSVMLRGENNRYCIYDGVNTNASTFKGSGGLKVNIKGNINSLIKKTGFEDVTAYTEVYTFFGMFDSFPVVSIKDMQLPTKKLTERCYSGLFSRCTYLVDVPDCFEAETIAPFSCNSMFWGDTSIIDASNLTLKPKVLSEECYSHMFVNNSSMIKAPELPATTLAPSCYEYMFYGCGSLTTAPELLAKTLREKSYKCMFEFCRRLNYIKCLATDVSATYSTYYFTKDIAVNGTFVKDANMSSWPSGIDGIPNGWNVVDE